MTGVFLKAPPRIQWQRVSLLGVNLFRYEFACDVRYVASFGELSDARYVARLGRYGPYLL